MLGMCAGSVLMSTEESVVVPYKLHASDMLV